MTNRANTTKYDLSLGLPVLDKPTVKKIISEHFRKLGKKGGKKLAERGSDYFRAMQKRGVEARRFKKTVKDIEL